MDISGFKDNIDLSEARWIGDIAIPGMQGVRFKVRSPNYKPFTAARDRAMRSAAMDDSDDAGRFWIATAAEMARHLLVDWDGVTMGGETAKFDADLALALFSAEDPHGIGERFRKALDYATSSVAVDLLAKREEIAGNSPKP